MRTPDANLFSAWAGGPFLMGLLSNLGGVASSFIAGPLGAMNQIGSIVGGQNGIGDMLTGGAISNAQAVDSTNRMQMSLAEKQMGFQERMSNSAYQRAVEDMRAAGLNPALAYQQGGASTPSGAMAQLTASRPGDKGAGLFNTAKALASGIPEMRQTMSQADLNKANVGVADTLQQKNLASSKETEQHTNVLKQLEAKAYEDGKTAKEEREMAERQNRLQKAREPYDIKGQKWDAIMDRVGRIIGGASSAAGIARKLSPGGDTQINNFPRR